jgi:Amt family ammonium transporter
VPEASEPAEYQDEFTFDGSPASEETQDFFGRSNGFIASSGVMMILGLIGYSLIIAAIAKRPSGRFAPLAVLGSSGLILASYWLFGFNTSYPMDATMGGFLPSSIGGPMIADDSYPSDPFDYGLAFTMWTDFFYQAAFAISSGVFVIGLMAGRFRTPLVVMAAVATGAIGFPIATIWIWGGGWLSNLEALDFGGAGNVHLLAGGVGLAMVALARICPPMAPWQIDSTTAGIPVRRDSPPTRFGALSLTAFVIGVIAFLLLPIGMQAGSVLAIDTPVVASVLHNTFLCLGASILTAAGVSIPLSIRPRIVTLFIAAIAGLAAIAAPADVLTGAQASLLGLIVGGTSSLLSWTFDRYHFDDPMGIVSAHLLGALFGMLAAGFASPDVPILAQVVAAIAFTALGMTIGACVGLLGWMLGLLWTPSDPPEPPPVPEVTQS